MPKRLNALFLGIFALVLALAVAPALAGKGGGNSTTTSSISIASINGTLNAASTQSPTTKLGDVLKFATIATGMAGWEYAMVDVTCYQDVNGDGTVDTSLLGPDIVYSDLDKPDASYTLGGYSSIWTVRVAAGDSAAATCRADLVAIGWKGGAESARLLAPSLNFAASA